jgi:vacuolar protein sorting-associated protein 35
MIPDEDNQMAILEEHIQAV